MSMMLTLKKNRLCRRCKLDIDSTLSMLQCRQCRRFDWQRKIGNNDNVKSITFQYCTHRDVDDIEKEYVLDMNDTKYGITMLAKGNH